MANYNEQVADYYLRYEDITTEEMLALSITSIKFIAEALAKNPAPPRIIITYVNNTVSTHDGFDAIFAKMYELFGR